jgi:hypothetical protein
VRENYERQKTGEEESIYLYICLGHLESAVSAFPCIFSVAECVLYVLFLEETCLYRNEQAEKR